MLQLTTLTTATTANKAITTKPELRALDFRCNTRNISGFRDSGSGPCSAELNAGLSANWRLEMLRNTSLLPGHYILRAIWGSGVGFGLWSTVFLAFPALLPSSIPLFAPMRKVTTVTVSLQGSFECLTRCRSTTGASSSTVTSKVPSCTWATNYIHTITSLKWLEPVRTGWGVSSAKFTRGRIPQMRSASLSFGIYAADALAQCRNSSQLT